MNQSELAELLGVSRAYVSMVMSGKKTPSQRVAKALDKLGVNQNQVNSRRERVILSHARLPVPTLPPASTSQFYVMAGDDFKPIQRGRRAAWASVWPSVCEGSS